MKLKILLIMALLLVPLCLASDVIDEKQTESEQNPTLIEDITDRATDTIKQEIKNEVSTKLNSFNNSNTTSETEEKEAFFKNKGYLIVAIIGMVIILGILWKLITFAIRVAIGIAILALLFWLIKTFLFS